MSKVEIDNKKMWESILGFQLEGEEAKKFNYLCKYKPFNAALAFSQKHSRKVSKTRGSAYIEGSYETYTHKGNCRFCKERRQKELEELVIKLKEK